MPNYSPERQDIRFAISAKALLLESETGKRCEAEVDNISHGGCFARTPDPFLVWAKVRIWVVYRAQQFEAEASVTHARPGFGMGISFQRVTAENHEVLQAWLRELGH